MTMPPVVAPELPELLYLRQFFYQCPAGLFETDDAGTVHMVNPAAVRLLAPVIGRGDLSQLFPLLRRVAPELVDVIARDPGQLGPLAAGRRMLIPAGADQLITDLLDLARYREAAPHRETVRLDLLTSEAVERLRQRLPQAVIQADLRPCLVLVDPAAVEHAVSNLVDNAVKWTPPGAVVRVTVAGGQVSVADHGPGIAADDLPRIFERFYRAPAAQGLPGSGLGLAIVGRVAQANDGTVAVRTGPDGSTFTLSFRPVPAAPG
jgi:Histidine kinase-, DNA gyrase B-, and HSP90-like ATPase